MIDVKKILQWTNFRIWKLSLDINSQVGKLDKLNI